ncbi:uncharacterized protein LOC133317659 [Gastrolobium bilobum]|uniref:uncharacterized protein LOC133317659 n=1 Tax=Gastrolobium bilobum TaxID=150636 RepID=UPI002AB2BF1F|nr:uncharacterized protein LOC133317659 [Gastrolobium bilobum]
MSQPQRQKCQKAKKHHQIQNPTMETNVQPQSISVELNGPAGSNIRTQTDNVSYDSTAIAIAPPKEPKAAEKMDVLTTKFGLTQLSQVTLSYLWREGFQELLDFGSHNDLWILILGVLFQHVEDVEFMIQNLIPQQVQMRIPVIP